MTADIGTLRTTLAAATSQEIRLRGWNQTTASERLDCSQPDISNIHRNTLDRLSLATILDIAAGVEIPIAIDSGGGRRMPTVTRDAETLRSDLMHAMTEIMSQKQWTLSSAATELETNIQRISDIRSGRGSRVSVEAAVDLAHRLGIEVSVPFTDLSKVYGPQWVEITHWLRGLSRLTDSQAQEIVHLRTFLREAIGPARANAKTAIGYHGRQGQVDAACQAIKIAVRIPRNDVALHAGTIGALKDTAHALVLRDLIGPSGFTLDDYDALTLPWRGLVGQIHADDRIVEVVAG